MTTEVKNQLGHTSSKTDGVFFMTADDFVANFYGFDIGYFNNDYLNNYVDEVGVTATSKTYSFTVPTA